MKSRLARLDEHVSHLFDRRGCLREAKIAFRNGLLLGRGKVASSLAVLWETQLLTSSQQ